MLQIKNICKIYKTGDLLQKALDDVSLSLRDSEFVAILGPSGSGKTTLLNVIGGLDRYDSGDLIINNVSTKEYRDRDWDAYRNHSIGFVFQSYNLIPHQTILANVELALTISGVGRTERRRRAREALEQVGLGDQLHKRPNQLSGGQMQRVAIARALVNDPAILLADEPTGALDTETSLQVMELLRTVAKDRLVVMVTHNAELAESYATRIVRLKDGKILSDSDPFLPENRTEGLVQKRLGRASMSFLTAIALSFNNLRTKLTRTLLTAFAGSIGIIGIALILSMSNGVDRYIQSVEEETLKSYPLKITDSTFDLSSMFDSSSSLSKLDKTDAEVTEWKTFTTMFTGVNANDLGALRSYFEDEDRGIYEQVQAIEYDYGVTPHIYKWNGDKLRQVNPDNSFAVLGFTQTENAGSLLTTFSNTDSFRSMPEERALYLQQYDVKAGHWPENCLECVVVLSANGRVPDMSLYALGLKDPQELDDMVTAFASGEAVDVGDDEDATYRYEDFLGIEFCLLHAVDCYTYDENYGVWSDRSADSTFLESLAKDAETMTVVGVVQPKKSGAEGCLTTGIAYPASLSQHLIAYAAQSEIVKAQLCSPEINVFTGLPFGEAASADSLSLDSLVNVDEDALEGLFDVDEGSFTMDADSFDLSGVDASQFTVDTSAFSMQIPTLSQSDIETLLEGVELQLTSEQIQTLFSTLLEGYLEYAEGDPSTDYSQLPEAVGAYLLSDDAREILLAAISSQLQQAGEQVITASQLLGIVEAVSAGYPAYLEAQGLSLEEVGYSSFAAYLRSDVAASILNEGAASLQNQLESALPTTEELTALAESLYVGYSGYAEANGLPEPDKLTDSFAEYLQTDEAKALLLQTVSESVDVSGVTERAQTLFAGMADDVSAQLSAVLAQTFSTLSNQLAATLRSNLENFSTQLSEDLRSAFELDPEQLAKLFTMNMDISELRDLFSTVLSGEGSSYRGNLRKLGYGDETSLRSITIYPIDFQSKTRCKQIIAEYNEKMLGSGQEEKEIYYTDMVETLMGSVTDIVNAISIVLIAFVAVSLIVSSIMIGIITYISVLERTKEIGILRAIGASKHNISSVFNAETFLVGLCAGILGVGITLLLLIPINAIIRNLSGIDDVRAILPFGGAVILVLLSMLLTLIAGLIPSRKAAKKDPVTALRTE